MASLQPFTSHDHFQNILRSISGFKALFQFVFFPSMVAFVCWLRCLPISIDIGSLIPEIYNGGSYKLLVWLSSVQPNRPPYILLYKTCQFRELLALLVAKEQNSVCCKNHSKWVENRSRKLIRQHLNLIPISCLFDGSVSNPHYDTFFHCFEFHEYHSNRNLRDKWHFSKSNWLSWHFSLRRCREHL